MQKDYIKSPNDEDAKSSVPVIDYSPKVYSIGKQILCLIKMLTIGGIILLLFWLIDKMHLYY